MSVGDGQLQQATSILKGRYLRKGLLKSSTEEDPWPPVRAKSYTSLALLHQNIDEIPCTENAATAAKIRTKGEIHKILTSSIKLDKIDQMFTPVTSNDQIPMIILVEGHPGIGKTTLAKEICLQWANNKLLTSDKLVILLMLRDPNVQKINNVEQLVEYTLPSGEVLNYVRTTNGDGITFIIDGFDELSNQLRQSSFFRKLIEGDILSNSRVVVTSRPSASLCLHDCVHRRIEVLGFEKSSREQFVDEALKPYPSKRKELKTLLQQNPSIDAMCYIPLNMAIIIFLCHLGPLPPTATEMFSSFILHTVCHHLKRMKIIGESEKLSSTKQLPQSIQEVLDQLQQIAFEGLLQDKIVFMMDELPKLCKDDPTCFGLLQSVQCYCLEQIGTPTLSFNFLHLGIQEYFAAQYVVTLPECKVYALMVETFLCDNDSISLSNMWIMYCGITKGQSNALKCWLSSTHYSTPIPCSDNDYDDDLQIICPILFTHDSILYNHCGAENKEIDSDGSSFHQQIIPISHLVSKSSSVSSLSDLQLLSIIPTRSAITEELFQEESSSDLEISMGYFPLQNILNNTAKAVYLFQCFYEAQDDNLCEILLRSISEEIIWLNFPLLPYQVVSLGFFLSRVHKSINELNLYRCSIADHGMAVLHHFLCGDKENNQGIKTLKTLDLSMNSLTGASLPFIAEMITHFQLHTLKLNYNKLTNLKVLCSAIINSSTIKVLQMECSGLTAQNAAAISDMMIVLEELNIGCNEIGDGSLILAEGIMKTTTLRVLDIRRNCFSTKGVRAIANSLLYNTSLEILYMFGCIEQYDEVMPMMCQVIADNKTLLKLDIADSEVYVGRGIKKVDINTFIFFVPDKNKVSFYAGMNTYEATLLATAITKNKTLKSLSLTVCDDESILKIIRSINLNNSITELFLFGNFPCSRHLCKIIIEDINRARRKDNIHELTVRMCHYQIFHECCTSKVYSI